MFAHSAINTSVIIVLKGPVACSARIQAESIFCPDRLWSSSAVCLEPDRKENTNRIWIFKVNPHWTDFVLSEFLYFIFYIVKISRSDRDVRWFVTGIFSVSKYLSLYFEVVVLCMFCWSCWRIWLKWVQYRDAPTGPETRKKMQYPVSIPHNRYRIDTCICSHCLKTQLSPTKSEWKWACHTSF